MPKSWFSAKAAAGIGDLAIYDDIEMGGATIVRDALAKMGHLKEIHVSINSPGGDIAAGFAIFNMLRNHPARKITRVDGIAASMASVIFMVGDERIMPSNTMLMIHNPWGSAWGEGEQLVSFGEALLQMRDQIISAYAKTTGLAESKVAAMMDRETWLDAREAKRLGFASKVIDAVKAAASFDLSRFKNAPRAKPQKEVSFDSLARDVYAKRKCLSPVPSFSDPAARPDDPDPVPPPPSELDALADEIYSRWNSTPRSRGD